MGNMIKDPVYRAAYRSTVNATYGRVKASAFEKTKFYNLGKQNPAQAKLISKSAVKDVLADIGNIPNKIMAIKTLFLSGLKKNCRKAAKEFNKEYKTLYPKTHKMRDKIIRQNKVSLNSDSTWLERINEFKPDRVSSSW